MHIQNVHVYARRLLRAHGDKAELEAAQRATACERLDDSEQARDWRRIQTVLREMKGPRAT